MRLSTLLSTIALARLGVLSAPTPDAPPILPPNPSYCANAPKVKVGSMVEPWMTIPAKTATFGTPYTIWCATETPLWIVVSFGADVEPGIHTVLAEAFAELKESWLRSGNVVLGHGEKGSMVYQMKGPLGHSLHVTVGDQQFQLSNGALAWAITALEEAMYGKNGNENWMAATFQIYWGRHWLGTGTIS